MPEPTPDFHDTPACPAADPETGPISGPALERDETAVRARDRVLLYTRGMDVEPLASLEFALESLRRAGSSADAPAAMAELHSLLRDNGITLHLTDRDGQLLRSGPPMNRRRMVAEELDRIPLLTTLKKWFRGQSGTGSGSRSGSGPEKGRGA